MKAMKTAGQTIKTRLKEPSTYLAAGVIFYILSGNDLDDIEQMSAWLQTLIALAQEHREEISGVLAALGIFLKEGK